MPKSTGGLLFAFTIAAAMTLAAGASLADHHLEGSPQVLAAAADAATAPQCPNAAAGAPCCATCQDHAKAEAAGKEIAGTKGECPCQRAKRLREKAAAGAAD